MLNKTSLFLNTEFIGKVAFTIWNPADSDSFVFPAIVTTDYGSFEIFEERPPDLGNPYMLKGNYIKAIEFTHSYQAPQYFNLRVAETVEKLNSLDNYITLIDKSTPGNSPTYINVAELEDYDKVGPNWAYGLELRCYLKGTTITLSNGVHKSVENLSYNDDILVWDFDAGCFSSAKALWITKPQITNHYYILKFSDGTELKLVGSDGKCHRLLNIENSEFTYGSYFHVGQHTFKCDESTPYLVSIELVEEEAEFYNVVTHYHMNCFINGILSSCGYNNMYPIKNMKFVKDERDIIPFETYTNVPKEFYNSLRLGEQDLSKRSIEKAEKYIKNMLKEKK